jgi:ABC-type polysaccharide/polyol phosphate transport system ATPase subunit
MGGLWSYLLVAAVMAGAATVERLALIRFHRNWFAQGFAGDGAFHLAVVRELKRSGRYAGVPYFLMKDDDEPDTYPILFHRFAALFALALVEKRAYLPNLVLWVALSTAAALYMHYVATICLNAGGVTSALIFTALFLAAASNLSVEANGLNYISLSERLLARFSCAFCVAGLVIAMIFDDPVSYAVAVLGGVVAALSSLFSRQALAFVLPPMALIALDPRPLYVLAASFLGALLVDGRYFLRGLRHMVLFSQAYSRVVKHSRFYKPALSRWVDWRKLVALRVPLAARLAAIEAGEPTQLVVRLPELALLAFVWATQDHVERPALDALLAVAAVYLLTTTPYLRHLGEAIRYFEYDAWLVAPMLLAIHFAGDAPVSMAALAVYAAWIGLFTWRKIAMWRSFPLPEKDHMRDVVQQAGLTSADTVFTVPLHLGAEVSARALCRTFNYQGAAVTEKIYRRFVEEVPMLKRDWRSFAAEHGVTHIVADKRILNWIPTVVDWNYDFSGLPVLGESGFYIAYRATPSTGRPPMPSDGGRRSGAPAVHATTQSEGVVTAPLADAAPAGDGDALAADTAIDVSGVWKYYKLYDNFTTGPVKERLFFWRAEKYFKRLAAVRDVSFRVRRGDVVGIIGPNGSGKTTLLKCIAGLLPVEQGAIHVRGKVTALLAQGVGVHPEFSGRENIFFGGLLLGMKRDAIQKKVQDIIAFSELDDYIDRPLRTYSAGMRARLLFSISMSIDPDILIVDEALAAGDAYFVRKCERRLREICASGATVLLVSHNTSQIEELCNRALFLADGRIVDQGKPFDVVQVYNDWIFEREKRKAQQQSDGAPTTAPGPEGTGEVVLDRITLHDGSGATSTGFYSGEPMTIRLHYRCTRGPVRRAHVFCGILLGPGSSFVGEMDSDHFIDTVPGGEREQALDLEGSGVIELRLEPLLLITNEYSLWVKLYTKEGGYREFCAYRGVAPFFASRPTHAISRGPVLWHPFRLTVGPATEVVGTPGEGSELPGRR